MKSFNSLKVSAIVVAAMVQGILFSYLWSGQSGLNLANETPEPGSIILMGLGAIALMRKRRKQ